MKSKLLIALLVVAIGVVSFTQQNPKALAEVQQMQGLYVFTDSKPLAEYEYMGTVKTGPMVVSAKHRAIMGTLLENARKEYPEGNGIILSEDYFSADVIRFK